MWNSLMQDCMCVPRSNYDLVNLIREKLHGAVRNYSNNLEQFMQGKNKISTELHNEQ
jgi:hypothetical protein